MADKRRIKDRFHRAARKSALASLVGLSVLTGCSSTTAREDLPETPQVSVEGRRLTVESEAIFKRNATAPVNDSLPEQDRLRAYLTQLCFGSKDMPKPEQQAMRSALEDLAKLPLTGRPLVEMAARENIQFCNIRLLPAGTGAQYVPTIGAVLAPGSAEPAPMQLHLAHEILHAAQDKNELLAYHYDWDIHSRLSRSLAIESAALSFEILVAFETRQRGDARLWDHLRTRYASQSAYGDPRLYTLAEETWEKSKAAGSDDAAALHDVGRALWAQNFENPGWLDFYLNFELAAYVRDITSGTLDDQRTLKSGAFGQEKIDAAGQTGGSGSFTRGAQVPPLEKLLAGNSKMRQAYAAADLERHRRSLGADHPRTVALRSAALAEGNPYIGLDLAAVLKQMQQHAFPDAEGKNKFSYLHEYLDAAMPPPVVPRLPPEAQKNNESAASEAPEDGSQKTRREEDNDHGTPQPVPPRDTLAQAKPAVRFLPPAV